MPRRSLVAVLVFAIGALVVIGALSLLRGRDRAPTRASPTVVAERDGGSPNDAAFVSPTDPSSIANAGTTTHQARESATTTPSTADAHLRVLVVAFRTRERLAGRRVSIHSQPPIESQTPPQLVASASGDERSVLVTDAEGRVEFACRSGVAYVVRVVADGGESAANATEQWISDLDPGETLDVVVEVLGPNDRVFVARVLDRETREPLVSASVRLYSTESDATAPMPMLRGSAPVPVESAITDANGLCRFELRTIAAAFLEIDAPPHARCRVPVDDAHTTPQTAFDVLVSRAAALTGTLVGASSGELVLRVPGENVRPAELSMYSNVELGEVSWSSRIDAAGRFSFAALTPGAPLAVEYAPVNGKPTRLGETVKLSPGESRVVEWQLAGTCTVRGRIVDARGSAVAEQVIWLLPATEPETRMLASWDENDVLARATSATNGTFEFAAVRPGAWWIGLASDGNLLEEPKPGFVGVVERVEIAVGDALRAVVLRVDHGLFVTGRIVTPDGKAPENAWVYAKDARHPTWISANTSDETFRLGPLLPGSYSLVASCGGYASSAPVMAEAGASDVELTLTQGAAIHGRVIDPDNGPPPYDVVISSGERRGARFSWWLANTDETGAFSFDALDPGTYDVVASSPNGRFGVERAVHAVAGGEPANVVVRLTTGSRLRIRSSFENGWILVTSDGVRVRVVQPDPSGPIECAIPPGRIRVELTHHKEVAGKWTFEPVASTSLDVAPGEMKEIRLDPPK